MFRQAFDAFPFALVFPVESLGVQLVPQTQGFDFTIQARQICFCGRREIKPVWAGRFIFELGAR
jgi:hypothetical protein